MMREALYWSAAPLDGRLPTPRDVGENRVLPVRCAFTEAASVPRCLSPRLYLLRIGAGSVPCRSTRT